MVGATGKICLQNPQYVPARDALTMLSPLSLPQTSGKTSEKTGGNTKQDAQTFENDSIFWAPKVDKRPRGPVGHNMHRFRFISEDIELVGMLKILGRVKFDAAPIRLRRCREFRIKIRVVPESQTMLLILETAEVPKNLFKAWIFTEELWHENQILGVT